jgi:hypothetical protein
MILLKLSSGSTANGCSIWMPVQMMKAHCGLQHDTISSAGAEVFGRLHSVHAAAFS